MMQSAVVRDALLACAFAALPLASPAATIVFDIDVGDRVEAQLRSGVVGEGQRLSFGFSAERIATPIDIAFLSDTTGSMGSLTTAAAREADEIVARTSTLGDVAYTIASYRDFPFNGWGGSGDYPFRYDQTITNDRNLAADGLRAWRSGGGADFRESNLYALQQLALNESQSFRAGSDRYLLWFGDAPSHDPGDTPGYPGLTVLQTLDALLGAGVTVLGVDLGSLDIDNELSIITAQTGGSIGALSGRLSDLVFDSLFEVIDPRTDLTFDLELSSADGASRFVFNKTFEELVRGTYELTVDTSMLSFNLEPVELAFDPDDGIAPIPLPAAAPLLAFGFTMFSLLRGRRQTAVNQTMDAAQLSS